jgi:hypothetical protein
MDAALVVFPRRIGSIALVLMCLASWTRTHVHRLDIRTSLRETVNARVLNLATLDTMQLGDRPSDGTNEKTAVLASCHDTCNGQSQTARSSVLTQAGMK